MKVTIKDIAERAGVSYVTVSNALRSNGRMADETRRHVLEVARDLGYRPNTFAKATRMGCSNAAGLLMSTCRGRSHISFGLIDGIQSELADASMHLVMARLPDEKLTSETQLPALLREWMTDGFLINYHVDVPDEMVRLIREHVLPSIWINANMESDAITPDDIGAGLLATEHLLARGHRRIAYVQLIGPVPHQKIHHSEYCRHEGYQQAMQSAGVTPVPGLMESFSPASGDTGAEDKRLETMMQWLRRADRPSAVVTYSSYSAQPLLHAAALLGIRVPEELAMTTIEDSIVVSQGVAITTVDLNVEDMGRRAVRMLLRKIKTPKELLKTEVVPARLIPGQTC